MHILIVDDNAVNRSLLQNQLQAHGHLVESAVDGQAALDCLQAGGIELIVSDILMPGMDGFQLCRRVKTDTVLRRIPFVFYTATYTGPQDEELARRIGADLFIQKPCEPEQLLAALEPLLKTPPSNVPIEPLAEQEALTLHNKRLVNQLEQKMLQLRTELKARQEAEAALLKSEEISSSLVACSPVALYGIDLDGLVTIWNPSAEKLFGWCAEEVLGRPLPIIPQQYCEEFAGLRERIREGESFSGQEVVRCKKNGTLFYASLSAAPLFGADGDIIGIMAAMEDISARKRATHKLQASEERFRQLFNSIRDALLIADTERKITQCNPAFTELFGYTEEEIIGRKTAIIYADLDEFAAMGQKIRDNIDNPTFTFIITYKKKNGKLFRGETAVFYARDDQGKIYSVIGSIRDITQREAMERALRDSEQSFRDLFQRHAAIKLLIDPQDGAIVDANQAAAEFYGWSLAQLKQMRIQQINTLSPEQVADEMERARTQQRIHFEFRHQRADGSVADVSVFSSSVKFGEKTLLHSIVHDISEQKKLEAQLRQSLKMESVGQLAGGIAHDFNNMLAVILGYAGMALKSSAPGSELHSDLQKVVNAAQRSADMTRQLLAFSRKQTIAPRVLDLNTEVEKILQMLHRLIGENIDLAWHPKSHIWPVKVDPAQLDQLLANLCINARDAISGIGKVTIETGTISFDQAYCAQHVGFVPGDFVLLAVSDSGCGMDEATRQRIFEPFFTTKTVGEGTGLGLATVYGIVKQNNGFINVYSEPGKGTTFRIYLPRQQAAEQAEIDHPVDILPTAQGETVLLVEDEQAVLTLTVRLLENLQYRVLSAADPAEGLELARHHPGEIALLITDTVMPGMNGRQLAEQLQQEDPELKVLYMSGYTANVIAHQGILEDGVHFLQKPFSERDLAHKVREALED